MKKSVLSFAALHLLGLALASPQMARAAILDMNSTDQMIYIHPTPTLQLSLLDLGNDGGILSVSLDYESAATRTEINDLQSRYPGRTVQVVMAEPQTNTATLSIPEIDLQQDLLLRQGQMGPYINNQFQLNHEQMRKAFSLGKTLADFVHFSINARASYVSTQVIEEYTVPSVVCSALRVRSVKDLISSLGRWQKPNGVRYPQTFDAFKSEVLEHCFSMSSSSVNSFQDLLNLSVQTNPTAKRISGQFLDKKSQSKTFSLIPHVKIEMN